MSGYDHLLPTYRRQAALPDAERIAWIRADRWLDFEQARGALARLENLLAYPPRDRMPCLLIYGDTGMGKTKIIRKFLRDHPASFGKATGVTAMPVVAMQMPAEPIERDIYGELLVSLGISGPVDGATDRQKEMCRGLLRSMGIRMLIIDEVHAMLAGSFRQQRIFLNAIRFLANDLKAPLVCAGTDLARQSLLTDPQLAERFETLHLRRWADDRFLTQLLSSLGAPPAAPAPLGAEDHNGAQTRARIDRRGDGADFPPDRDGRRRGDPLRGRMHHQGEFRGGRPRAATRGDDAKDRAAVAPGGGMIFGGLLPIAPRPFEDELLSSWQGRIACRYDLTEEGLSERLGVGRADRWIGFSGRDFAPAPAAVSAWAKASRLSERRVKVMALSMRRRPVGLYVWRESSAAGAIRRPVCPARLSEDGEAGRDHHIRRSWAPVESCLSDRHGRFLSETCAHCPSQMGFRFRNRGGARLVCVQRQGVVRSLEATGGDALPRSQGVFKTLSRDFAQAADGPLSAADAVLRAARRLWAAPCARGASATPFISRVAFDAPLPPRAGAVRDRSEPLATASLGWRMATLLGIARLFDMGGARRALGSAPFTLDQLAQSTGETARSGRCAAPPLVP